jgi:hypothetical protein
MDLRRTGRACSDLHGTEMPMDTPHEVFRQVLAATGDRIAAIRTIRERFGLDVRQAKEIMLQAEGVAESHDEHLQAMAWELENVLQPRGARHYLGKRLAPLASLKAQRRWIAGASQESYLVPEQLLEDAVDIARYAALPAARARLPPECFPTFERLAEVAAAMSLEGLSSYALVGSDARWAVLRKQAIECLKVLEFDLGQWEAEHGLSEQD